MHGLARVWVKGHAEERNRELRLKAPRSSTGDPHAHKSLMHDLAQMGARVAGSTVFGTSPDGPKAPIH